MSPADAIKLRVVAQHERQSVTGNSAAQMMDVVNADIGGALLNTSTRASSCFDPRRPSRISRASRQCAAACPRQFYRPHPIRSAIAAGIPSRVADFAGLPSVALERMTSNTSRRRCVLSPAMSRRISWNNSLSPATRRRLRRCAESYGIDGILFVRALEALIFSRRP